MKAISQEHRRERKMPQGENFNGSDGETPGSAAHYIAAISGELAKIAKRNGLDMLGMILDMARLEADQANKQ